MFETALIGLLGSVLSGAIGAVVVYFFGIRRLAVERRIGFRERQLSEFYAPLAGIRKQILSKSTFRLKVSNAANAAWHDICRSYGSQIMLDHEERYAPFKKIIEYENAQLENELIPLYREMLKLFTDRYHLAQPETRDFYAQFLEFVEIWNRSLAGALPGEVLEKLGHDESRVTPFYEHLETQVGELQDEIAGARSKRATLLGGSSQGALPAG
jgi:hypothetical protein